MRQKRYLIAKIVVALMIICTIGVAMLWKIGLSTRDTGIEVYFSPDGGAQEAIIDTLNRATSHVYVAMFYMSSPEIVQALCDARERGVQVFAVFDDSQRRSFNYLRYGIQMRLSGIPVRYSFPNQGKMHSKFAVFDGLGVIAGSYNWTISAEQVNVEDMTITRSRDTARFYEEQFARIWLESDNP